MIVFDLKCSAGHRFEGCFRDSETFTVQAAAGEVACPVCGDLQVKKTLMISRLNVRSHVRDEAVPATAPTAAVEVQPAQPPGPATEQLVAVQGKVMKRLREIRREVEANCDFVGDRFAEEVRSMNLGENPARPARFMVRPPSPRRKACARMADPLRPWDMRGRNGVRCRCPSSMRSGASA